MRERNFSSFTKRRNSKFKRRDYKNKKFENPFFQKRRKSFLKPSFNLSFEFIKKRLFLVILIILFFFGFYFFVFSSKFNIYNINIKGLSRTPEEKINEIAWSQTEKKRFFIFKEDNLIFYNTKEIEDTLRDTFGFAEIDISKDFFHDVNINIQEKSMALIFVEEGRYYYSDIDGYIINEVSPVDIKTGEYAIIENQGSRLVSENKIAFDQEVIKYAVDIFNKFNEKMEDMEIEKIFFDYNYNTVKVKIVEGPELYFNVREDTTKQIDKLILVKNEKLKDDFFKKTYIDLRYGDMLYYR